MNTIKKKIARSIRNLIREYERGGFEIEKRKYGYVAEDCDLRKPSVNTYPQKVFLYENTHIYENATFIISDKGEKGRFIMKKNSAAAQGLTVVTNAHAVNGTVGVLRKEKFKNKVGDENVDVVVHEDVWIGTNVTLLPGSECGRGSVIGAGSVIRKKIPPYAIVIGNPAKVVGFTMRPDEIIEHEKLLYNEFERISMEELEKNYKKFFKDKLKEIQKYI